MGTKSFKKAVAVTTILCFVFTSILSQGLYAMVDRQEEAGKVKATLDEFLIPYTAGRITEAGYFGSRKVVVNIQDLHCHPEVQRNIAKILSLLDERYGLKKVYVEGGIGQVDTSWVKVIEDKGLRQKIVESLVDSGKLTGAEYYSIKSKRPDLLAGLEEEKAYKGNLIRLGEILEKKGEIEQAMPEAREKIEELKRRYYEPKNRKLEELIKKNKEGKIATEKYYKLLLKYAEKSGVDVYEFGNINAFLGLIEQQKRFNYGKITRELQGFIYALKQRLPYNSYSQLMEKTKDEKHLDELYLYLSRIAREYKIELSGEYGQLAKFFEFVEKNQKINPLDLVREEKRLISELHSHLSQSEGEREVAFVADFYGYLEDYLNNKMSAEDYGYFTKRMEEFRLLWTKYISSDRILGLEGYYGLFGKFYEVNVERNNYFIKNILGDSNVTRPDVRHMADVDHYQKVIESLKGAEEIAVVVTGGFHTSGLAELLKDRKVSYLVITPNVTRDTKFADLTYNQLAKEHIKVFATQTIALPLFSEEIAKATPDQLKLRLHQETIESNLTLAVQSGKYSQVGIAKEVNQTLKENGLSGQVRYEKLNGTDYYVYTGKEGAALYLKVDVNGAVTFDKDHKADTSHPARTLILPETKQFVRETLFRNRAPEWVVGVVSFALAPVLELHKAILNPVRFVRSHESSSTWLWVGVGAIYAAGVLFGVWQPVPATGLGNIVNVIVNASIGTIVGHYAYNSAAAIFRQPAENDLSALFSGMVKGVTDGDKVASRFDAHFRQLARASNDHDLGAKISDDNILLAKIKDEIRKKRKTGFLKGEAIDIIDENDNVITSTDRKLAEELGLRHRTANAFVVTPDGKLLLQRRVHNKAEPKNLSIFGGHVGHGQSYNYSIRRELLEELSLDEIEKELQGKLNLIGQEGQFVNDLPNTNNREYRSLYVYVLTPEEYEHILQRKAYIDHVRKTKTVKEFEEWLVKEQQKPSRNEENKEQAGYGEVWDYHVVPFDEIDPNSGRTAEEHYRDDNTVKEEVGYTTDLLLPLLKGTAPLRPGMKAVDPLSEVRALAPEIGLRKEAGSIARDVATYANELKARGLAISEELRNFVLAVHKTELAKYGIKRWMPASIAEALGYKGGQVKYESNGNPKTFRGITIVSNIRKGAIVELIQRIIGNKYYSKDDKPAFEDPIVPSINKWQRETFKRTVLATVPPGSEHVTIWDLLCDDELQTAETDDNGFVNFTSGPPFKFKTQVNAETKAEIKKRIDALSNPSIEEKRQVAYDVVRERVLTVLKSFSAERKPRFKPAGIAMFPPHHVSGGKSGFVLKLEPATPEDYMIVTKLQEAVKQATGIKNFEEFVGHFTLAYAVDKLETDGELRAFQDYFNELDTRLKKLGENERYWFELPLIEVSYFESMEAYPPVADGVYGWLGINKSDLDRVVEMIVSRKGNQYESNKEKETLENLSKGDAQVREYVVNKLLPFYRASNSASVRAHIAEAVAVLVDNPDHLTQLLFGTSFDEYVRDSGQLVTADNGRSRWMGVLIDDVRLHWLLGNPRMELYLKTSKLDRDMSPEQMAEARELVAEIGRYGATEEDLSILLQAIEKIQWKLGDDEKAKEGFQQRWVTARESIKQRIEHYRRDLVRSPLPGGESGQSTVGIELVLGAAVALTGALAFFGMHYGNDIINHIVTLVNLNTFNPQAGLGTGITAGLVAGMVMGGAEPIQQIPISGGELTWDKNKGTIKIKWSDGVIQTTDHVTSVKMKDGKVKVETTGVLYPYLDNDHGEWREGNTYYLYQPILVSGGELFYNHGQRTVRVLREGKYEEPIYDVTDVKIDKNRIVIMTKDSNEPVPENLVGKWRPGLTYAFPRPIYIEDGEIIWNPLERRVLVKKGGEVQVVYNDVSDMRIEGMNVHVEGAAYGVRVRGWNRVREFTYKLRKIRDDESGQISLGTALTMAIATIVALLSYHFIREFGASYNPNIAESNPPLAISWLMLIISTPIAIIIITKVTIEAIVLTIKSAIDFKKRIANPYEYWTKQLGSSQSDVRNRALIELGNLGDKRAIESIMRAYSTNFILKIEVLEKLGASTETILEVCNSVFDPLDRKAAIKKMGELGDPRAIDLISRVMDIDNYQESIDALMKLGVTHEEIFSRLIQRLSNSQNKQKHTVVRLLGRFGDKRAIDPLIKELKNQSEQWDWWITVDEFEQRGWRIIVDALVTLGAPKDFLIDTISKESLRLSEKLANTSPFIEEQREVRGHYDEGYSDASGGVTYSPVWVVDEYETVTVENRIYYIFQKEIWKLNQLLQRIQNGNITEASAREQKLMEYGIPATPATLKYSPETLETRKEALERAGVPVTVANLTRNFAKVTGHGLTKGESGQSTVGTALLIAGIAGGMAALLLGSDYVLFTYFQPLVDYVRANPFSAIGIFGKLTTAVAIHDFVMAHPFWGAAIGITWLGATVAALKMLIDGVWGSNKKTYRTRDNKPRPSTVATPLSHAAIDNLLMAAMALDITRSGAAYQIAQANEQVMDSLIAGITASNCEQSIRDLQKLGAPGNVMARAREKAIGLLEKELSVTPKEIMGESIPDSQSNIFPIRLANPEYEALQHRIHELRKESGESGQSTVGIALILGVAAVTLGALVYFGIPNAAQYLQPMVDFAGSNPFWTGIIGLGGLWIITTITKFVWSRYFPISYYLNNPLTSNERLLQRVGKIIESSPRVRSKYDGIDQLLTLSWQLINEPKEMKIIRSKENLFQISDANGNVQYEEREMVDVEEMIVNPERDNLKERINEIASKLRSGGEAGQSTVGMALVLGVVAVMLGAVAYFGVPNAAHYLQPMVDFARSNPFWAGVAGLGALGIITVAINIIWAKFFPVSWHTRGLQSKNPDVQKRAIVALGKLGDKRAVEPIIKVLNEWNYKEVVDALDKLESMRDQSIVERISTKLREIILTLEGNVASLEQELKKTPEEIRSNESKYGMLPEDEWYVDGTGYVFMFGQVYPMVSNPKHEELNEKFKDAQQQLAQMRSFLEEFDANVVAGSSNATSPVPSNNEQTETARQQMLTEYGIPVTPVTLKYKPETLKARKEALEKAGLPVTVANLTRNFAKRTGQGLTKDESGQSTVGMALILGAAAAAIGALVYFGVPNAGLFLQPMVDFARSNPFWAGVAGLGALGIITVAINIVWSKLFPFSWHMKGLNSKNLEIQRRAIVALEKLGDRRGVEPLTRVLGSREYIEITDVEALEKMGATREQLFNIYIKMLAFVHQIGPWKFAAERLGKLGDKRAIIIIIEYTNKNNFQHAIRTLTELGASEIQIDQAKKKAIDSLIAGITPSNYAATIQDLSTVGASEDIISRAKEKALQTCSQGLSSVDDEDFLLSFNGIKELGDKQQVINIFLSEIENIRKQISSLEKERDELEMYIRNPEYEGMVFDMGGPGDETILNPAYEALDKKIFVKNWRIIVLQRTISDLQIDAQTMQPAKVKSRGNQQVLKEYGIPVTPATLKYSPDTLKARKELLLRAGLSVTVNNLTRNFATVTGQGFPKGESSRKEVTNNLIARKLKEYLDLVGPVAAMLGRIPMKGLSVAVDTMHPGATELGIRKVAPRLLNANYFAAVRNVDAGIRGELRSQAALGLNPYYVAALPEGSSAKGLVNFSEARVEAQGRETDNPDFSSKVDVVLADGSKVLVNVYGEKVEAANGRSGWILYYRRANNGPLSEEIRANAGIYIAKWVRDNKIVREKLGISAAREFSVDVYETDLANFATIGEAARGTDSLNRTVFVSDTRDAASAAQTVLALGADGRTFDVIVENEDGIAKLGAIASKMREKTESESYLEGRQMVTGTFSDLRHLDSPGYIERYEKMVETFVLEDVGSDLVLFKRVVDRLHGEDKRVVTDYPVNGASQLGAARESIGKRMAFGTDGVRVDLRKYSGDINALSAWLEGLRNEYPEAVIGVMLPEGVEFSDTGIYRRLGIKTVVIFTPDNMPAQVSADQGGDFWYEMSDKDTSGAKGEYTNEAALEGSVKTLASARSSMIGFSANLLDSAYEQGIISEWLSFENFVLKLLNLRQLELSQDPAYQYGRGYVKAMNSKELPAFDRDFALKYLRAYKTGNAAIGDYDGKLFGLMGEIAGIRKVSGELSAEETSRFRGYSAGYMRGIMEKAAVAKYLDSKRPFMDERHNRMYGAAIVEAQLVLNRPEAEFTDAESIVAALKGLNVPETSEQSRKLLAQAADIRNAVEHGASMGTLYPEIVKVINALSLAEKGPMAIAGELELLVGYADRNEKGIVDQFREEFRKKAIEAIPAATRAIAGAA